MAIDRRIIELPKPTTGVRQGVYAKYNPVNDKTEQLELMADLGAIRAAGIDWQTDSTYSIDDIVLFNLRAWKSLQNNNTGNAPAENTFWTEIAISEADGITDTQWAAGLFTYDDSKVVVNAAQYYLNVPAPFESSDFAAELTNGDWLAPAVSAQPYADLIPQQTPPAHQEARFYYDDVKKNFVIYNDISDVQMDVGLELWLRVRNDTASTIPNGSLVYIVGINGGGLPTVELALSNDLITAQSAGFVTHDIPAGTVGYLTAFGTVADVDTTGYSPNDQLWLSDTVPGAFQGTSPLPPSQALPVGRVFTVGATGVIGVSLGTIIKPEEITMSANFNSSVGVTNSDNYIKGFYTFDTGYTPDGGGDTFGTANIMYGAHYYVVLGAASTDMVVRVTGNSWNENVEVIADFELIDTSGGTTNDYFQTDKKWNGQVTITLESGTGVIMNSGYSHYWDNNNRRFILTQVLWTGVAGANDTGPDFKVLHHKTTGWTYVAGGALPPTPLIDLQNEITDGGLANGQAFSFKVSGFTDVIEGDNEEGIITVINYNSNSSIAYSDIEFKLLQ